MTEERYATPMAARRALTDRLRRAAASGPFTLAQLQRQAAYDRLLARLYAASAGWVIKGAGALIARGLRSPATPLSSQVVERGRASTSS